MASLKCGDYFRKFSFSHARLSRFMTEINLNQHGQGRAIYFFTHSIQSLRQRRGIQRVNNIEQFDRAPRLFDCRWPIKCHFAISRPMTGIFVSASWTRFSPKSVNPD